MKPKKTKSKKRWISDEEMKRRIAIPISEFHDEQLMGIGPWSDTPIVVKLEDEN